VREEKSKEIMEGEAMGKRQIEASVRPIVAAKARLQIDKVSNEPLLLYPEGLLQLNATGAAILSLCDGKHTFEEILIALAQRYKTTPDMLREDISDYLNDIYRQTLLEFHSI
jgi:pyrroloquinoline quinone biosynthesis protein D